MPDPITSLIEKLEGAEVGSGALSNEVLSACGYVETRFPMDSCPYWVHPSAPRSPLSVAQEGVTTSLDAALALAERVLPKLTRIEIKTYVQGEFHHCTIETDDDEFDVNNCRTPALALCAAILRAQSEAR